VSPRRRDPRAPRGSFAATLFFRMAMLALVVIPIALFAMAAR
jgi:hypothetical protein